MSLLKKKYKIILPISILSALFLLLGCEDKKDLEDKVYKQYNYINHLKKQNSVLKDSLAELNISLKENIDYSNKLKKGIVGKSPNDTKYILTLRCKQTSITFDVTDMVKDKLNVFEFDIMVDERLYNKVRIGENLTSSFKEGSLLFSGKLKYVDIYCVKKKRK